MFKKRKEIQRKKQIRVQQMTMSKYLLMNEPFAKIAEAMCATQK